MCKYFNNQSTLTLRCYAWCRESGAVKEVPAEAVEAKERVDQAFTPDVLNSLCRVIINKHLVMGTDVCVFLGGDGEIATWNTIPTALHFHSSAGHGALGV